MRRPVLVALGVLAAGVLAWQLSADDTFRLPAELVVEDVLADLSAAFDGARDPDGSPRAGGLEPRRNASGAIDYRPAILAPAPSRFSLKVYVPERATLRFGVGVGSAGVGDAAGVRFALSVDGKERWARVMNPAANRQDRRWIDDTLDLDGAAGREVELTFATRIDGPGEPAGVPGWSRIRLVRRESRARQAASTAAPSVIVLLIDTLRADRLGCYGATPSPSPELDRLAAEGLLFEQAVAQAPWTLPSVATLFTGLHPRSHGVVGGSNLWGDAADRGEDAERGFLAETLPTLAAEAARHGITTVGVSGNPLVSRATNLARGFETFVEIPWGHAHPEGPRAGDINDVFLRWLGRNRGQRFLAYLHYMEPHGPYTPSAPYRPPTPAGLRPEVASGRLGPLARAVNSRGGARLTDEEVRHLRRLYDGEIRSFDAELTVLLERLAALGLRDSTVLIVTADHGEEFQEHGRLKHGPHLYEESIRVPLVVVGPGVHRGRAPETAQGIDLFPTVAALLGFSPPPGLPGQNVLATREARPVVSETHSGIAADGAGSPLLSLRTPGWKLIHAPATDRFELYDLAHDPGELEDRFGRAPEGAALVEQLAAWRAAQPAAPNVAEGSPELRARLRALGYVDR